MIALRKQRHLDTMTQACITFIRAALCCSLIAITILAVIPLETPPVAGMNDKISHMLAFYFLTLLADFSFPETKLNYLKIVSLLLYGFAIEWVQYYIPYREFSLWDIMADAGGIALYALFMPSFKFIPLLRIRWRFYKNN